MKRNLELIYLLFFILIQVGCNNKSPDDEIKKEDNAHDEAAVEDSVAEQDNSTPVELKSYFTPGHYERKGTYGTNKLRIDSIAPDKCYFVFDWGKASCYTKLAGELTVDENGKGTFHMPACEALDFTFKNDYVSLKEYKCNFHGSECAFDGMFKLKTGPSYEGFKARTLLGEIEDGSKTFEFYASFTEPFWTIYIWKDIVVFNHMDGPPGLYETNRLFDPDSKEQTIYFSNEEREWKMIIRKQPGSDGMSNITYPYSVELNGGFHGGGGREYQREDNN